mmetsp:Transcript_9581/g.26032  ORF Transcript_9581/g.26032 Transcript_9581/m.26032 type:complete len:253 (+) Transcript_9581:344-1102(+)
MLHKLVDQVRPGTIGVVLLEVRSNRVDKVEQLDPRVSRHGPLVVLLEEGAPLVDVFPLLLRDQQRPYACSHVKLQTLLVFLAAETKGILVNLLERLGNVQVLPKRWDFHLQRGNRREYRVYLHLLQASLELLLRKLTHCLGVHVPADHKHHDVLRCHPNILAEGNNAIGHDFPPLLVLILEVQVMKSLGGLRGLGCAGAVLRVVRVDGRLQVPDSAFEARDCVLLLGVCHADERTYQRPLLFVQLATHRACV